MKLEKLRNIYKIISFIIGLIFGTAITAISLLIYNLFIG